MQRTHLARDLGQRVVEAGLNADGAARILACIDRDLAVHARLAELVAVILDRAARRDAGHRGDIRVAVAVHELLEPGDDVRQVFDALEHQDRADLHQRRAGHDELDDVAVIVDAIGAGHRDAQLGVDLVDPAQRQRLGPDAADASRPAQARLAGLDVDREAGVAVGGGDAGGASLLDRSRHLEHPRLVGRELDHHRDLHRLADARGDLARHLGVLADHRAAVHPGHHRRMRAAEVQLDHRQTAVLDGAADVDPALHRLAAGAADQV